MDEKKCYLRPYVLFEVLFVLFEVLFVLFVLFEVLFEVLFDAYPRDSEEGS
jgi:hypothetical protein